MKMKFFLPITGVKYVQYPAKKSVGDFYFFKHLVRKNKLLVK
jgi:hypothetical protein